MFTSSDFWVRSKVGSKFVAAHTHKPLQGLLPLGGLACAWPPPVTLQELQTLTQPQRMLQAIPWRRVLYTFSGRRCGSISSASSGRLLARAGAIFFI